MPRVYFVRLSKWLSRKGIYTFLRRQLSALSDGQRVLNVGAGGKVQAVLSEVAAAKRLNVLSLDVDPSRQPDVVGDVCTVELASCSFDAVVMLEVLEHVHSPSAALANVLRVLRPGGIAVVSAPFIYPIHEAPHDYFRYTEHGLRLLFRGFSSVDVRARNSWGAAICVLLSRHIIHRDVPSRLLAPFLVVLAVLALPAFSLLSLLLRTNFLTTGYTVVARK